MTSTTLFHFRDRSYRSPVAAILRRLPPVEGASLAIETARGLRDRRQAVHAGSFLRERRIALDCTRAEFPRIFVHELFHFVWLRAGNPVRHSWEALLRRTRRPCAGGELGWSAEWRKQALRPPTSAGAAGAGANTAARASATPRPGSTPASGAIRSSPWPPVFAPAAAPGFTETIGNRVLPV
jgi:hypothetical protein